MVRTPPNISDEATSQTVSRSTRTAGGFSLLELLIVMAIVALLASVSIPAFSAFGGAGRLDKAASDISDLLAQARAYAMGKNTYVYVGIEEVDVTGGSTSSGGGRVAVAVVASKDGSRPYANTPSPMTANIQPISRLHYFDNIHLAASNELSKGAAMTGRPSASVDVSASSARTTFQLPGTSGQSQTFNRVIEFDPQGVPRIQSSATYNSSVSNRLEIALLPVQGKVVMADANQAAIQIDGMTGSVRMFRP